LRSLTQPRRSDAMKIQGTEGMSTDEIRFEVQRGAKFVFFYYSISVLVMSFRRASPVYFIPAGQNALGKGLPWILLTLVAGWWGIPWGPIYTVQSLVVNFKGGKDVTAELSARLQPATNVPDPRQVQTSQA
jgi:hypothetical protein